MWDVWGCDRGVCGRELGVIWVCGGMFVPSQHFSKSCICQAMNNMMTIIPTSLCYDKRQTSILLEETLKQTQNGPKDKCKDRIADIYLL